MLARGVVTSYLGLVVLIPLAALLWRSAASGYDRFVSTVTSPEVLASIQLTILLSLGTTALNALAGTLIAWVLVRDSFPGKRLVDSVIDLPFAIPTVVAGLTLLALYGPRSPIGVDVAYTKAGVGLALLFVTLPFVVRSVQPVLLEMDREVEEAAASLGASGAETFRRIVLPSLLPAILSGASLGFARSLGEFGAVVLISGNVPFRTEVVAVTIFGRVESGDVGGAAVISVVLLLLSGLVLLMTDGLRRWRLVCDG